MPLPPHSFPLRPCLVCFSSSHTHSGFLSSVMVKEGEKGYRHTHNGASTPKKQVIEILGFQRREREWGRPEREVYEMRKWRRAAPRRPRERERERREEKSQANYYITRYKLPSKDSLLSAREWEHRGTQTHSEAILFFKTLMMMMMMGGHWKGKKKKKRGEKESLSSLCLCMRELHWMMASVWRP